jgi:crossover junction endodeoxyribonuclease RuvC
MTRIIGIDPGLCGALAVLEAGRVDVFDMPTIRVRDKKRIDTAALVRLLVDIGPVDLVAVEDVQGVQGSGSTSAFTFGRGIGIIEGVLAAFERPAMWVTPQRWTKALGVSRDKGEHRQRAARLFPADADLFARVKDDGRADAALIAHYAAAVRA